MVYPTSDALVLWDRLPLPCHAEKVRANGGAVATQQKRGILLAVCEEFAEKGKTLPYFVRRLNGS